MSAPRFGFWGLRRPGRTAGGPWPGPAPVTVGEDARPQAAEDGAWRAGTDDGLPPGTGPVWLFTRWALAQVAADPVVRDRLDGARLLVLLGPGQQPLPGIGAAGVATFAAVEDLRRAAAARTPGDGTGWALYDPEAWAFTPAAEQRDPAAACAEAADAAHRGGLRVIAAPALSLTTVLAPSSKAPRWQRYLDLGLAAAAARAADVVELQAQSLERDTATYTRFVRAAADQARAVRPRVPVLAGLSTNPPGAPVTARQLIAAVAATRAVVDGYWLNIPRPGPKCPTCNPPRPDLGVELLREFL